MRTLIRILICALCCALGVFLGPTIPAHAQSDAARLQGLVLDPSGAVVPGADVKVTNPATNRTLKTTSDATSGAFSFVSLPPGNYRLDVSKSGFKTLTQPVTLEVAQVANLTLNLQTGAVSESVVVTDTPALIDSASSDMGSTVQTKEIEELPLNGRNFTQLATLIPGVTRGVPNNTATGANNNAETFRYGTSGGAALVVNGARPQSNNFLLDGADNNESLVNTIVFFPPAEALQEFKVQTSIPPAEFGRAGGAIVNTTLKSGSNEIHGAAFDFLRNSELDARATFASARNPFRRNQFGADIGAPIIRNKLFIFGDYQGFRQSTPVGTDFASVPTPLMRQGDFSELLNKSLSGLPDTYVIRNLLTGAPFPGNIIPANLQNPVGLKYLNAYPLPNISGQLQQNYQIQRQQVQNFDDFDIRADWNPTEKDRLFNRFSFAEDNEDTSTRLPGLPAGFGSGSQLSHDRGDVLGYTRIFTPIMLNDLHLSFQRSQLGYLPPYGNVPLSANLGIPNANTSPLLGGGALIGGYNSQLEYTGDYGTYNVPENTYQLADSLSVSLGNHSVKLGLNLIWRQVNLFRPKAGKGYFDLNGNGVGPGSTGYEIADILAGFVNNYQIGAQTGMFGTRSWENGFFVQDDWRFNRHLTLNLGIRWEYLTPPTEVHGRQANFNLDTRAIDLATGADDPLVRGNSPKFSPRVGFAYDLAGNGKTVVRGGYGIFYFVDRGGIDNQLAQNAPFSGISQYNYSDGYRITLSGAAPLNSNNWIAATGPLPTANFSNLNLQNPQNLSLVADKTNNQLSYMEQWNIQLQRQITNNMVASLAYVGAGGHHLIDYYDTNSQLFNTPNGTRLFPNLGSITVADARGNSIYHGLQAELQRRFTSDLQFTASYTFSRTIDDGGGAFQQTHPGSPQDFQNIFLDRGPAEQDIRNRFVLSGVYTLPFGIGRRHLAHISRAADAVIGGWQANAILTIQSGLPFNLFSPGNPGNGRPDQIGPVTIHPGNTAQYFSINSFAEAPLTADGVLIRPGTFGRDVLIGPGVRTLDMSLFKNFALTEKLKLEFRAEAFNIANHPVFSNPNGDMTAGNFGQITGTLLSSERQIQFAAKMFF
jgi:hypothetical protein